MLEEEAGISILMTKIKNQEEGSDRRKRGKAKAAGTKTCKGGVLEEGWKSSDFEVLGGVSYGDSLYQSLEL